MMELTLKSVLVMLAISFVLASQASDKLDGSSEWQRGYRSKTAVEKLDFLWSAIEGDKHINYSQNPGLHRLKLISGRELADTFELDVDFIPNGRVKKFHEMGAVAKFVFKATETNPYREGVFVNGTEGIMRISLATGTGGENFSPGFAFKVPRDGKSSLNWFAMPSIDGQGSNQNPFLYPATNIPDLPEKTAQKLIAAFFQQVKPDPAALFMDHVVGEGESIYKVSLEPRDWVRKRLATVDLVEKDFRVRLSGNFFKNKPLWDVYATMKKGSSERIHLGTIEATTVFIANPTGDLQLFFQHHKQEWEGEGRSPLAALACPFHRS